MLYQAWIIPILPLLGAATNAFLGARLGKRFVSLVACGTVGLAFWGSAWVFADLTRLPAGERLAMLPMYQWISAGDFQVNFALQVDPLSAVMLLVVSGVSFLIHVYSTGYMAEDRGYARYFTYLNLFVFSMLLLVTANNFLVLYVGWELVGLCSYLLIGFWYERKAAADAGKKAFIVNRVGDLGFALGVMLIFVTFGSLDYQDVFAGAPQMLAVGSVTATTITLLLFVGATGKSAQIPLYVWLPDAMEGPTPVSALIHAATMVTAGVYMVARTHALFELAPFSLSVVATIGAVTAFYAATIALVQADIKRMLAYSTISQLGYMFLAVGVGAYAAGIFHLTTHAFFKALLFLGAGSVMHALGGETNMLKMGGLRLKLPVTYWAFVVGALAISGFPGLSGFFSKDAILWQAFASPRGGIALWAMGLATGALTAFYALRAVFLTFHGESRLTWEAERHVHEPPSSMALPLGLLAALAALGGYLGLPHILGGSDALGSFLAPVFLDQANTALETQAPGNELGLMGLAVLAAFLGMGLAWYFYLARPEAPGALARRLGGLYALLANKYYVDEIYGGLVVQPLVALARFLGQRFEVTVIDGVVNGVGRTVAASGAWLRRLQTGFVRNYALSIFLGAVIVLGYFLFR
ncbi:MAG: NADH-quinone oxidoreductase subunit L [Chloroflexi bacterium]|nr:NADH-quinone oxidoreductase subunit L [Chloroflexota bacterium]